MRMQRWPATPVLFGSGSGKAGVVVEHLNIYTKATFNLRRHGCLSTVATHMQAGPEEAFDHNAA
eukprot:scaffold57837_cov15-Tisochrysis_lutea.AAC.2